MHNNSYIGYTFTIHPLQPASEILIAQLGAVGFESFLELNNGIDAYIQTTDWYAEILDTIQILQSKAFSITYTYKEIKQTNWNAEWEKNFKPIIVDNLVTVRAPFHKAATTKYDVIIEPKMSFGTGHHETTHMMIQQMLECSFQGQRVLDMGCGTGVLAILAEKLGAIAVDAIDIDHWCYRNSIENIERNSCTNIAVFQGDASLLTSKKKYDIIIANINRNVLLADIPIYANYLNKTGILVLSGFYNDDVQVIEDTCKKHQLFLNKITEKAQWVSLKFIH